MTPTKYSNSIVMDSKDVEVYKVPEKELNGRLLDYLTK